MQVMLRDMYKARRITHPWATQPPETPDAQTGDAAAGDPQQLGAAEDVPPDCAAEDPCAAPLQHAQNAPQKRPDSSQAPPAPSPHDAAASQQQAAASAAAEGSAAPATAQALPGDSPAPAQGGANSSARASSEGPDAGAESAGGHVGPATGVRASSPAGKLACESHESLAGSVPEAHVEPASEGHGAGPAALLPPSGPGSAGSAREQPPEPAKPHPSVTSAPGAVTHRQSSMQSAPSQSRSVMHFALLARTAVCACGACPNPASIWQQRVAIPPEHNVNGGMP